MNRFWLKLYNIGDKYRMNSIKKLKNNKVYRVTDLFFRRGVRWEKDRNEILSNYIYRNTILFDYLKNMRFEEDILTLKKVVEKHCNKYESPPSDALVIHLRVGDVMNSKDFQKDNYKNALNLYKNLNLEKVSSFKKAVIVTAMHFGANDLNKKYYYSETAVDKSLEVIQVLQNRLQELGMTVNYKSSENVDEDICYMVGSRYFVKSTSNLSNLVALLLKSGSSVWEVNYGKKKKIGIFKAERYIVKRFIKKIRSIIFT